MKEFIAKLLVGMIINAVTKEQALAAFNVLKADMQARVLASPGTWDDMAFAAYLKSEDDVMDILLMFKGVADEMVASSASEFDDSLWLPISAKLGEIIEEIKATN